MLKKKTKKAKKADINLFYMNEEQEEKKRKKEIENKKKSREKRINENKKNLEDEFDAELETVINMTNKNNIEKEQKKKKEFDKQARKRKKRNKRIKRFLKIFLFLGITIGGGAFVFTSPIFNIKQINVSNNNVISSETIISLSGLQSGQNIFKFYGPNIIEKIKENPYIEDAKIKRKLPNTIQIDIEERVAKFSIDYMGKYAYINTQGYILEIAENNNNLPVILGVTTSEENTKPGLRLINDDLEKLELIIKIMDVAKENNLGEKVTSIDIGQRNEYSIYIAEEGKKIHLGDGSNLSNKMLYVVSIIEAEKGKEGDIYVDGDLNNKFRAYFREKVEI